MTATGRAVGVERKVSFVFAGRFVLVQEFQMSFLAR